jgi:septum formation protein
MLILASSSPRRYEILSGVNDKFEVVVSNFEEIIDPLLPPEMIVQDLALGKGREVLGRYSEDVIVCGDTIVYFDSKPLGKVKDTGEAFKILLEMSGKEVYIYTGNGILTKDKIIFEVTNAKTVFREISKEEIDLYLADPKADWMDKAGAFAVQGKASVFTTVVGEWETALGLSKAFLQENLAKFNLEN